MFAPATPAPTPRQTGRGRPAALAELPPGAPGDRGALPPTRRRRPPALARALRGRDRFSLGYYVELSGSGQAARWRWAAQGRWRPALDADGGRGKEREGAWVAELTGAARPQRLARGYPADRAQRDPHPGAQLRFTDLDGHRFQCFPHRHPRRGTSPASRPATASTPGAWTRSGSPERELGLGRLPFQAIQSNQAGGSNWRCSRKTCSPGRLRLLVLEGDLAGSRNRSGSATASSTSPATSPAPAAAPGCACRRAGPGPSNWRGLSRS